MTPEKLEQARRQRFAEYPSMWVTVTPRPEKLRDIRELAVKLLAHKHQCNEVAQLIGCPGIVVAVIQGLEAGGDFTKHAHNGDPLSRPTVQDPAHRPPGPGPFTWKESALDALRLDGADKVKRWGLCETLWWFERYNGLGYWSHGTPSPYLWSFTNLERPGRFVHDGPDGWRPDVWSSQPGVVCLLKELGFQPQGETP